VVAKYELQSPKFKQLRRFGCWSLVQRRLSDFSGVCSILALILSRFFSVSRQRLLAGFLS
jgi:hypothetical protein